MDDEVAHAVARLPLSLRETLEWARALAAQAGGQAVPAPLGRLAAMRGIAPRTLREHLARLESLGLLTRVYAGNAGLSLQIGAGMEACTSGDSPPSTPTPVIDRERTSSEALDHATFDASASTDSPTLRDAVALLTGAGVYPQVARALARSPWVTRELIEAWLYELRGIRAVRTLAAVLVHTLRDPTRCLPAPSPPEMPATGMPPDQPGPGSRPPRSGPLERVQLAAPARPNPPAITVRNRPPVDNSHRALWDRVHAALASRLPCEVDELWLQHAHPLSCSDGTLFVAVPSTLAAEWLNLAGAPRAREAIQQAAGRSLIVRFIPAGLREPATD